MKLAEVFDRIKQNGYKGTYVYGAGALAESVLKMLVDAHYEDYIIGILVSSMEDNPHSLYGFEVQEINASMDLKGKIIFIATTNKSQFYVKENLKRFSIDDNQVYCYDDLREDGITFTDMLNQVIQNGPAGTYIYGAGKIANELCKVLKENNAIHCVAGFIVTKRGKNLGEIENKKVYELGNDIQAIDKLVVIGTSEIYIEPIRNELHKYHIDSENILSLKHYSYYVLEQQARIIDAQPKIREWFGENYTLEFDKKDVTYSELHMVKENGDEISVKLDPFIIKSQFPYYIGKWNSYDMAVEYSTVFGGSKKLKELPAVKMPSQNFEKDFQIFMVESDLDFVTGNVCKEDNLIPIQAGAMIATNKVSNLRDDMGDDNISQYNKTLCELTALYWVWKNSPRSKYKGLCHYRRHFDIDEEDYKRILCNDVDAVLTTPRFNAYGNLQTFLMNLFIVPIDVDIVEETIKEKHPEYVKSMQEHFRQNFFYNCNMVIAKEEIFNEYCEFLFDVILPLDSYFRRENIQRTKKFSAFFAELITSLFFYHNRNRWNIQTADFVFYE